MNRLVDLFSLYIQKDLEREASLWKHAAEQQEEYARKVEKEMFYVGFCFAEGREVSSEDKITAW